ncbi:MAG: sel1 repeat family protein [Betaproteobacteria bacterium]|nr:sel1 repeat family protein [Betaproteobacteria bacterium]
MNFESYLKAAGKGDAQAQYNLGNCFYYGKEVEKDNAQAVVWWRLAAEQGNAQAQCNLGYCYCYGGGVAQDYVQAVKWSRKAADQGLAKAQFNLGQFYFHGEGVAQDYVQAVKWYHKAAVIRPLTRNHNCVENAAYRLSCCYSSGVGVLKDEAMAEHFFSLLDRQRWSWLPVYRDDHWLELPINNFS